MLGYDMQQLSRDLGLNGHFFLTREQGERAYHRLVAQLRTVPESQPLILTFPPHQVMDASFADETLVRLGKELLAGDFGDRCVLLQGLTDDSQLNLDAVIHLQRLKLAFLAVEPDGAWQLVGALEANLQDTLQLVARHAQMTAPELASLMNLELNTASTRLKRLYDLHLLRRDYAVSKRGLEYTYYFWNWHDAM